jgi:hypothetical protein
MLLINIQHPIRAHPPTIIGKQTSRFQEYPIIIIIIIIQEAVFYSLYAQGMHSFHYLPRNASYSARL